MASACFAFFLEENGFPVAPVILGVVLGPMLEENFVNSMIKSDGHLIGLFNRPIAAVLAALTVVTIGWSLIAAWRSMRRARRTTLTHLLD